MRLDAVDISPANSIRLNLKHSESPSKSTGLFIVFFPTRSQQSINLLRTVASYFDRSHLPSRLTVWGESTLVEDIYDSERRVSRSRPCLSTLDPSIRCRRAACIAFSRCGQLRPIEHRKHLDFLHAGHRQRISSELNPR